MYRVSNDDDGGKRICCQEKVCSSKTSLLGVFVTPDAVVSWWFSHFHFVNIFERVQGKLIEKYGKCFMEYREYPEQQWGEIHQSKFDPDQVCRLKVRIIYCHEHASEDLRFFASEFSGSLSVSSVKLMSQIHTPVFTLCVVLVPYGYSCPKRRSDTMRSHCSSSVIMDWCRFSVAWPLCYPSSYCPHTQWTMLDYIISPYNGT